MRIQLIGILALVAASSVLAAPVMPQIFFGTWASTEKPEQCNIPEGYPIDFPESGLKINADGIMHYEGGCSVSQISKTTEKSVTATFSCGSEGESEVVKMTLTISADGKYLSGFNPYGGSSTYIRCE